MHYTKRAVWHYFLLSSRVLLAWILFHYGWSKLNEGQFGVDDKTMKMKLEDIDLFRLSWYLADHQPFKAFVGTSQIVTSILMIYNRTFFIGALISIPIWLNILIWDMTFMNGMTSALLFRLSFYIMLTIIMLYQRKDELFHSYLVFANDSGNSKFPIWAYLLLPIGAIAVEFILAVPHALLVYFQLL